MSCRTTICQECATQWEGIHYCVSCVAARQKPAVERARPMAWLSILGIAVLSVLFAFAIVRLAVGIGAFLAGTL